MHEKIDTQPTQVLLELDCVKATEIPKRVTKVTVLTKDKLAFRQFLQSRKIQLEDEPCTEVWQGIESAYTVFALSLYPAIGEAVYQDWCNLQDQSSGYPFLAET